MTPIRALVVDDEVLARTYLMEMLKKHPEIEVVGQCANGFEAVKAVSEHQPELLFLDIQMPKLDGFEVLELIEKDLAVVFVTAYDQYALKAFDSHAVDYLLKPFSASRLAQAVKKVQRNVGVPLPPVSELKAVSSEETEYLRRVVVRDGGKVVIIPIEQIEYVKAEDDYISIFRGGQSFLKHQTISSLEKSLPPFKFVRIHRSTLVNVNQLDRIELMSKDKYVAILKDRTELKISRSGHKLLKKVLDR